LRTVMCSPVRASTIAQVLKIPRATVLRRLNDMVKLGYVEHVGNAYRMTDKVNIPELGLKLKQRIDMIVATARELSKFEIAGKSPEL
jgi:DNA-binding IclR family transcriptional regulator